MLQSAISDVAQYNSRCCTVQQQMMDCATSDVVRYSTNKSKEPSKATNPPTKDENRPPGFSRWSLSKVMWRGEKIMLPMMNVDGCPSDRSFPQSTIPPVPLVPSVPFVPSRLFITRQGGQNAARANNVASSLLPVKGHVTFGSMVTLPFPKRSRYLCAKSQATVAPKVR